MVPYNLSQVSSGVPNGTTALGDDCRGLLVGTAGQLIVVMQDGNVLSGVPFIAGINPGYFVEVRNSTGLGTPASNIWKIS